MKPRSREVSIFNLSMLDVISGALGALILIMIVLFPFYGKQRTEDEFQQLRDRLREMEKRRSFVFFIEWQTRLHDVDLLLDDGGPDYPPGHVATQRKRGPGTEMHFVRDAPIGMEWKIFVRLTARNGNPAKCKFQSYYLNAQGLRPTGEYTIPQEGKWYSVGKLVMTEQGQLQFLR